MWLNGCGVWSFLVALSCVTGIAESSHYNGDVGLSSGGRQAGTNFECKEEGYHADPGDCKLYYRCVDWGQGGALTKFKFECGPGTVFSKQRGDVCTHPNESGRSECGGSDENEHTNDVDSNNTYDPVKEEQSNSRPEYPTNRPSYGSTYEPLYGSPSGPSYVPPSGTSPKPSNSPATGGTVVTSKPTSNWSPQHSSSTATTRITDGTNQLPTEATTGNDCQADGFLADPQDCSKFYRCVDQGTGSYKKHEFRCGEGTVWDPQIEACNHPWAANRADCKTSQPSPSQENGNNDAPYQTGPDSSPSGSSLAPPPPCQTETPPPAGGQQGPVTGNVPTPKPSQQPTPGTQQPQGGSQQGSSPGHEISQPPETTPSNPQPTAGPDGQPQKPDSSKPGSPSLSKDEACSSEGFFGDADDCSKFYRCVDSGSKLTKYEFKCGDGTVWDDRIASCNHKYAVPRCGGSDQGTGGGNQQPDGNNNEVGTDQGNGNGNEGIGDIDNEVGTDQENGNGNEGTGDIDSESGQRPDSGSSSSDSTSSASEATTPTATTSESSGVDQGSTSAGEAGTTASTPATENTSQVNPSAGTTPQGSDSTPASEKPSPTGTPGNGECATEGFFPDPKDCSKFYRCVSSGSKFTKYEFQCGEGTVWDEKITSCNHKSEVPRCGGNNQGTGGGNERPEETDNEIGSEQGTENGDNRPVGTDNEIGSEQGTENGDNRPSETDNEVGQGPESESSPLKPTTISGQPPSPTSATTESSKVTEASTNSGEVSTPPSSSTGSTGDSPSSSKPDSSESSTSQTPSPGGPLGKGQCTKEGFFSDPDDCKKFYRCVAGEGSKLTKYEFTCGEGTAWDDKIQSCNHAYAVPGCGGTAGAPEGQPLDDTSSSGGSTGDSGESGQGGTGTNPESSSSEPTTMGISELTSTEGPASPEQESQEPSSTTQASEVSSETSAAGENEIPSEASSTAPPSNQPSENTTPTGENELPSESPSTTQPTSQPSEATPPTSGSEPPNESSSTTQSSGQPSEATTPDDANQKPTEPSSTMEPSSSPSTNENEIPSESQTSSTPVSTTTQAPQSTPVESSNNGQGGNSGACNSEGFFPNKNDCRKFYRCVAAGRGSYTKYEFSCGPGTAWDQNILTCNYIHLVESCGADSSNEITDEKEEGSAKPTSAPGSPTTAEKPGGGSPNEPSSTENNVPSSGKPAEVTKPVESTSESSSESTSGSSSGSSETTSESTSASPENGSGTQPCNKPEPTGVVCNEPGFYSHPTQCAKFYRCVDNGNGFNVYHFDCPPGTIFDPSISVCNYPESVYPPRNCPYTKPASPDGPTESSGDQGSPTGSTESSGGQGSSTGSTESGEGPSSGPTPTEAISTTGKDEETATSTEASGESTSQETSSEAPVGTTESAEPEVTTETSGESTPEVTTENPDQSTGAGSTDTVPESTTEGSGETSGETQTTTGQEESTTPTSTEAEASTESPEGTTIESQEQSTTETPQQSTEMSAETSTTTESEGATSGSTESGESTTQKIPPGATPCPLGDLTGEQIVLVCPTGFRRHPKYCNIFYQCISEATMEVKILSFSCPENTIFDEAKVQCLPETESSQPCTGVKAGARFYRRIESSSTSLMKVEKRETLCPDVGHYPYRDGCSNVFYKCKRDSRNALQGYVYKCPQDFVYWSVSRRCERASRLPMCAVRNSSHRDQSDIDSFSSRWQLPVEDYNLSARMLRYPY